MTTRHNRRNVMGIVVDIIDIILFLYIVIVLYGLIFGEIGYSRELGFYSMDNWNTTIGEWLNGIIHYNDTHLNAWEIIVHIFK